MFDFIQILLGDEATVRKQGFIDCTHLVDAEICIGNTPTSAVLPAGGTRQAHQVDDAQHTAVTQFGIGEHLRIFRIKDMCLQRCNPEYIVKTVCSAKFFQFLFGLRVTVVNQLIELGKGFVQIVAIPHFVYILTDIICNIAQRFQ